MDHWDCSHDGGKEPLYGWGITRLFNRFDATLRNAGYLPMFGQILDATLITAPQQRNTNTEKVVLRARRLPEDWQDKPTKLSHKDRHAR